MLKNIVSVVVLSSVMLAYGEQTMTNNDRWNAQQYKNNSAPQFNWGMQQIEKLDLRGDEQVLDIGCGDGRLTAEIAKRVPKGSVLGVDVSANMIDEAQKTFSHIKNLAFVCSDATAFSADKKFDVVVSFAAFHWIKDQRSVLQNIFQTLKPGGFLFISMSMGSPIMSETFADPQWRSYLHEETFFPHTPQSLEVLLKDVGFKNVTTELVTACNRTFATKESLFQWIMTILPASTNGYLSQEKMSEFANDVIIKVIARSKPDELSLGGGRLLAWAKK